MTRQFTSAVRHKLLRSPHAKRPPRGRLRSSPLGGNAVVRNAVRARSPRIPFLGSWHEKRESLCTPGRQRDVATYRSVGYGGSISMENYPSLLTIQWLRLLISGTLLMAFLVGASSGLWAQSATTGALRGTVVDPSGAVVPNATVVL